MSAFDAAFDAAMQQPLKSRPPEPPRERGLRRNSSSTLKAPKPRQPEPPPAPKPKKVHLVGRPNLCPCGGEIPLADDVAIWLRTRLGNACVHTHPGCEHLATTSEGGTRIAEPVTKEERAARAAAEEARSRASV